MADKSDDGIDELLQARKKEAEKAKCEDCNVEDCEVCQHLEPPCCPACSANYYG